jgi:hypothetical protein
MAIGPSMVTLWKPFVLVVGFVSDLGGLVLYAKGSQEAGAWAMALGTAIVIMEIAAIGGAMVGESLNRQTSE